MSSRQEREAVADITQRILDKMPSEGQCLISLGNQTFLLSISSSVGEEGACKLWIQGRDGIKVDDCGPVEPFNQLIFRARVLDSPSQVELIERHGYSSIDRGEEIDFLRILLAEGEQNWRNDEKQDWAEWIGLK